MDTAVLLAVDPTGLGGAVLVAADAGDESEWLERFRGLLPAGAPVRRLPASVTDDRLLGGLDLATTLATGRAVAERGALAAAHGGAIVLTADRIRSGTWSHLSRALDDGAVIVERDGLTDRHDAAFALVAVDERGEGTVPRALIDRLAFLVDVRPTRRAPDAEPTSVAATRDDIAAARARLSAVTMADSSMEALVNGAESLGIRSSRVLMRALACARASAALRGATEVDDSDLSSAARLVFGPRAGAPAEPAPPEPATDPSPPDATESESREQAPSAERDPRADAPKEQIDGNPTDIVVQAAQSALAPGMLAVAAARASREKRGSGKAGEERTESVRGRQIGVRRGDPRGGKRLDLVATLRTAAPFQRIRRGNSDASPRVFLRRDDFRVRRCTSPSVSTSIFVVDASGSAALARLAEAKGAVELMLTEGYARRERVAVIAFRGTTAALVLPPTSALARAKRAIGGLAGGGGTPLASALTLAAQVADSVSRSGSRVTTILLTDGRANVMQDGSGGRAGAEAEALVAARRLRDAAGAVVLIDTSVRPLPFARELGGVLGARYLALPSGRSGGAAAVVRDVRASND